jgi:MFS family permease
VNDRKISIHWAWVILGSCFVTLVIAFSIRTGAYAVLLPEMLRALQITKAQGGMIKSSFAVAYLLFSPLMGWLTDRIGGRRVISFFSLFVGGGAFLMSKTGSLTTSAIFFGIVGIGAAAMWVPIVTLIQTWFGEKKRGLALGILSPSYGIGFGLMGLILPVIVSKYDWQAAWAVLGIAGLLLIILNGLLLRDQPEKIGLSPWNGSIDKGREIPAPSQKMKMGYLEITKGSRFWILGICYFGMSYGTYTVSDFIVTYGTMELKLAYSLASFLVTVIAFSGVIGGILLMALSDYIGREKCLTIVLILDAFGILFVVFAGSRIPLLMVGMGWLGFFYGAIWPLYAACVRDYFPKEVAGSALGLLTIFYGAGAMVSPVLTGYLADITGTFRWSFGLGGFTVLVAALMIGILRKPRGLEK